jgi:uncharacterized phage protein gp47/JayE
VDAALDLSPDQPLGQIVGIFAEKYAELTQLGATVYNALNPDAAEGALLANLAAISGTRPQVATYSTVTATVNLNASTTLPAGAAASVSGQAGNIWVSTADAVNSSAASANVAVVFRASTPGHVVANAGTLTVIGTPTPGWNSITNAASATLGLAADTDATLRARRKLELSSGGSGDVDAIRAAVLLSDSHILSAFVRENATIYTNASGEPPHSVHVIIWDSAGASASNAAVGAALWASKPAGIQTYGATAVNVTDASGNTQTVFFDRATQVVLHVACTTTPSILTAAQTLAVKSAIAAYANATFGLGTSVTALPFRASALVPGVTTDVPSFAFDTTASPTNTANITISQMQIATVSTANVTVNGV